MENVLDLISKVGIVPVIKLDSSDNAIALVDSLAKGGIPIAEITFRTDAAYESIKKVSSQRPGILVGAGTVIKKEQVDKAIEAGAKFIVSPGFNPKIVSYCIDKKITITPGCTTPSEIEQAIEFGLKVIKFFPSEQSGGLEKIKALSGPYTNMKFIPTGGIDLKNIATYTQNEKVLACGGTFMVKDDFIKSGEFDKITELSKTSIKTMLDFSLVHIGINSNSEEEAKTIVNTFSSIFSLPIKDGRSSAFAGTIVEVMKLNGYGKNGHIAISTTNVIKAKYHLESIGIKFDEESIKKDANDNITVIYLKEEIAGFAVHLVKK